jgi:hypothetical protein
MITFCIVIYTMIMFCMTFKHLMERGDGPEGFFTRIFATPIFAILCMIGVAAFFKLYNIHFTVG